MYRKAAKPFFDFTVALIVFILMSPVLVIVGLTLAIANKGSIFFTQKRPGYRGKPFTVIKFKTMNDRVDESGELLEDSERLTRVGKWVRKYSLDEIPQLLNVIKGDLSIVGPRPLLMEYMELYNQEQIRRHEVKPGITGWAQVNGRNAISWEQKFAYDIQYVNGISLSLDLKILWRSVVNVILAKDINQSANVPMPRFTGTRTHQDLQEGDTD